jgi:hypothetical protein
MKRLLQPQFLGTAFALAAIVGFVSFANGRIERQVELAANHNFSAASLVTHIQLHGERMRRYEKEMFIYAAVPDKRAKYVKEFDDAYGKLLDQLNAAQATLHKGFSDGDREKVKSWAQAASFYGSEFRKVATSAELAASEQQAGLTTKLNADIGPGKDRFRTLLDGAAAMREEKLQASLSIGKDIAASKRVVDYTLGGAALLLLALVYVFGGRRDAQAAAQGKATMQRQTHLAASR